MMTSNYRCITIDLSTEAVGEKRGERGERGDRAVETYSNVVFTDIFLGATHTHTHKDTVDAAADTLKSRTTAELLTKSCIG